jgi:hypothetical protein
VPNVVCGFLRAERVCTLNKLILEITARKGGDDLVALLRRVLVISNPDDVH